MSNVLIGFIGRGRVPTREEERNSASRAGYVRTAYAFEAEGDYPAVEITTSLFSSALLQRMQDTERAPVRWLVMGTAQSNWADLIEAVPTDKQDDLLEIFDRVSIGVNQGNIDQELLNKWQSALRLCLSPMQVFCRLVGTDLPPIFWTLI